MRALKLWFANLRTRKSKSLFSRAVSDLTRANESYLNEVAKLQGEISEKNVQKNLFEAQIENNQKLAAAMAEILSK